MNQRFLSRRELLMRAGGGIGSLALADLLMRDQARAATTGEAANPLAPRKPHYTGKAKAVISIFCYGGVSQLDTFDPKPELYRRRGEAMAGKGQVVVSQGNPGGLMPSPWAYKKYGQCGMDVSDLFPKVGEMVDDIAFIRSMISLPWASAFSSSPSCSKASKTPRAAAQATGLPA